MGFKDDLSGKVFGRLVVLNYSHSEKKQGSFWYCRCDCGQTTTVARGHLISGHTRGCGCKTGRPADHGDTGRPFYKVWVGIKERCHNANSKAYQWYGAKGITMCPRWYSSYENFKLDMWDSYMTTCTEIGRENITIDRINSKEGYYPENCRWISRSENTSRAQSRRYSDEPGA